MELAAARCPDDDVLSRHVVGLLAAADGAVVDAHIAVCPTCRRVAQALTTWSSGASAAATPALSSDAAAAGVLAPGASVGRYVVLHRLGAGGMGVVYLAYDPELDRQVALKVLRAGEHAPRLRQEAQALARLAHPNVVAIHEIVGHGGADCVVMEYVRGVTLAGWLAAAPRSRRAVIAIVVDAARGLAAAHAAGLVHRDVKPGNLLVGADGRVRVGDFGLAAPAGATDDVAGTLAYMAPEQLRGGALDGRADQFALCVTLYEALTGALPFTGGVSRPPCAMTGESAVRGGVAGDDTNAIAAAQAAGPPRHAAVPAWLHRVLQRGLAVAPAARHADLDALIDALDAAPRRRRRRWAIAGAAAVLGLVAAIAVLVRPAAAAAADPCPSPTGRLAGIWDPTVEAAISRAFAASGRPYGDATRGRAVARLAAWGESWRAAHREVCQATAVRHEQSAELLDARMFCLDGQLDRAGAVTAQLAAGDASVVDRTAQLLDALPDAEACRRRGLGPIQPPPEAAVRARVVALHAEVARLQAGHAAGRYRATRIAGELLVAPVIATGHAPLIVELLFVLGGLRVEDGDPAGAEQALLDALTAAAAASDDDAAADVWARLIYAVGSRAAQPDRAAAWLRFAEAAVRRAGAPPMLAAGLAHATGTMWISAGRYDDAVVAMTRSLELRQAALAADDPRVARALDAVCQALTQAGRTSEALPRCEQAVTALAAALGDLHPVAGAAHLNLANALGEAGRLDEADRHTSAGVASFEAVYGPEHERVATAINNRGSLRERQGRFAEARDDFARAVAIRRVRLGGDDPRLASTLAGLGYVQTELGELAAARATLAEALAIQERAAPTHPDVATTLVNLADVDHRAGDQGRAAALLDRALVIQEAALGADHPDLVVALWLLGEVRLAQRRPAAALPVLERARALPEVDPAQRADVDFSLARAQWDAGRDRAAARALAAAAAAVLVDRPDIAAWRAAHQ